MGNRASMAETTRAKEESYAHAFGSGRTKRLPMSWNAEDLLGPAWATLKSRAMGSK